MPKDWINRLTIAYFLILAEVISVIALAYTPRNDAYYIVSSAFNFAIIFALPYISRTNLIVDFQLLNFLAFFAQGFGFFGYWYEIPVIFYNYAIHAITALQVIRLMIIRGDDEYGLREDNHWVIVVRHYYFHYFKKMFKKENL